MDEEIERLVISVRADTGGFRRDVDAMRGELEGPFADGAARAGQGLERALATAVRTGKLGFDDLRRVALSALSEIAAASVRGGVAAAIGGGGGSASIGSLIGALFGLPGRATGGPVTPGRGYRVGERGPELFVPTSSGRIDPSTSSGQGREVRLNITINTPQGGEARALQQSSRQVARAVKQALLRAD